MASQLVNIYIFPLTFCNIGAVYFLILFSGKPLLFPSLLSGLDFFNRATYHATSFKNVVFAAQACGVLHAVEPLNSFLASLCKFTISMPNEVERRRYILYLSLLSFMVLLIWSTYHAVKWFLFKACYAIDTAIIHSSASHNHHYGDFDSGSSKI